MDQIQIGDIFKGEKDVVIIENIIGNYVEILYLDNNKIRSIGNIAGTWGFNVLFNFYKKIDHNINLLPTKYQTINLFDFNEEEENEDFE
jgi:hypothetical protein